MFTSQVTKNLEPLFKDIQIVCLVKYGDITIIREDNDNNCLHLSSVYSTVILISTLPLLSPSILTITLRSHIIMILFNR